MVRRKRPEAARPRVVPRLATLGAPRVIALGAIALAVAFVALLSWDLFSIKRDVEAGRDSLDDLTLASASATGLAGLAGDASDHLAQAADRARQSLPLRALSLLPVADDQVAAIRRMTGATATLGAAGAAAAVRLDEDLEAASEPPGRIALLDAALEELDGIERALTEIDLGSADGLLAPLRDAHEDLGEAIVDAQDKLRDGRNLITPIRELLDGPSTFVLLAANNAEMAGGAGLALSAGLLTFDGGEIDMGHVVRAGALRLSSSVEVPAEMRSIYHPTGVGIDLRSTTRTPDLASMGPVVTRLMAAHGAQDIDGVVVVDAVALRDLMEVTGGVTVEGTEIDAENVLEEVLHANYLEFEGEARAERVSYQGDIAKAVFDKITTSDVSITELAEAVLDSSKGRHVVLWGADPDLQDAWEELDVAGALDERGLMISFQNYGADKLDWYLRPTSELDVQLLPSGDYRARLTMSVAIPALDEMPGATSYIIGPTPEKHGVFLTVHLPKAAYDITTPDRRGFRTKGDEPPMQVRTFLSDVPLGTTFTREIEFSLPREVSALLLLPSARMEPMPLTVDGVVTVDDAVPIAISWLAANLGATAGSSVSTWVRAPALAAMAATVAATGGTALGAARRRRRATSPWPRVATIASGLALVGFAVAGVIALLLEIPRV